MQRVLDDQTRDAKEVGLPNRDESLCSEIAALTSMQFPRYWDSTHQHVEHFHVYLGVVQRAR